jgi:hypothetical protein
MAMLRGLDRTTVEQVLAAHGLAWDEQASQVRRVGES